MSAGRALDVASFCIWTWLAAVLSPYGISLVRFICSAAP